MIDSCQVCRGLWSTFSLILYHQHSKLGYSQSQYGFFPESKLIPYSLSLGSGFTERVHVRALGPVAKVEGTVPKTVLTSDTSCKFKGSQNHHLAWYYLERLTGLTESWYIHSYALLQGEDRDKGQPKEKTHRAESRRVPNTELL